MFIGGYVLRFFGTVLILLYEIIVAMILRKKIPSFKEIWSAPYTGNIYSSISGELLQKIIGFIFILLLIALNYYFHW